MVSLTGSAFDTETQRQGANQLFSRLVELIDRGDVSYGKLQMEVIVPAEQADAILAAARELGATASGGDV